MDINIRQAKKADLKRIIDINLDCFPNDNKDRKEATAWVGSNFSAHPRIQFFVAEVEGKVCGYIDWMYLGGFRSGVLELDQIGVHSDCQGGGIGSKLLKESLEEMKIYSKETLGVPLKIVKVDTMVECPARRFYEKNLKAEGEAVLKDFFYGNDEVILIKRF